MAIVHRLISGATGASTSSEIQPQNLRDQGGYVLLERSSGATGVQFLIQARLADDNTGPGGGWCVLDQIDQTDTDSVAFDSNGWATNDASEETLFSKSFPILPFMRIRVVAVTTGSVDAWLVE